MIRELSVKNFKSIKELKIDCRRVNLFIGGPNTGKSNVLEALGLLSWCGHYADNGLLLKEYVRFQSMENLYYDTWLEGPPIEIGIWNPEIMTEIRFENDNFSLYFEGISDTHKLRSLVSNRLNYSGNVIDMVSEVISELTFIKFYRFDEKQDRFSQSSSSFLMPPHGSNMFAVVMGSKRLREIMKDFFEDFGFRLVLRTTDRSFEIQKQIDDIVFSYPYISISDTLQRMIFYTIAIESNKNTTLVFEEPESHAFPYYTGLLGEKIAFDKTNQYFIATHNPYFLLSILEKTPKDDVNVFITYVRDYQTKVKCLNDEEVPKLMRYDPFFNLDSFIEGEEE